MECNKFNGINDCTMSIDGIKKIYLFPYNSLYDFTYTNGNTSKITDYKANTLGVEIKVNKGSILKEKLQKGNTDVFSQELTLNISKIEWEKRVEIMNIIKGRMTLIIQDSNGKCWILGKDHPARTTSYAAATGKNNGYDLTIASFDKMSLKEIKCYDSSCAISVAGSEVRTSYFEIPNASSLPWLTFQDFELLGDNITRDGVPLAPFNPLVWNSNPAALAGATAFFTTLVNPNGNSFVELFYNNITNVALFVVYSTDTTYPFLSINGQAFTGRIDIQLRLITTFSTALTGVTISVTDQASNVLFNQPINTLLTGLGLGLSGITQDAFINVSLLYPLGQTFNVAVNFNGSSCSFSGYTYVYEPSNECQLINQLSLHEGKHYTCTVDKMTALPTYREIVIVIGEIQFNLYNFFTDYHSSFTQLEANILLVLSFYPDLNITNVTVTEGVKDWTLTFDSIDDNNLDFYIYTRGNDLSTIDDVLIEDIRKFVSTRSTILALQTAGPTDSYLTISNTITGSLIQGEYALFPDVVSDARLEEVPPFTNDITRSIGIDINAWNEDDVIEIGNLSASCPDIVNSLTIDTCLDVININTPKNYYKFYIDQYNLGKNFTIISTSGDISIVLGADIVPANYADFGNAFKLTLPLIFNANLQFDAVQIRYYLELIVDNSFPIDDISVDDSSTMFTKELFLDEYNIKILDKQHPDIDMEYNFDTFTTLNVNRAGKVKDYIIKDDREFTKYMDFRYNSAGQGSMLANFLYNSSLQGYTIEFFYVFPSNTAGIYTWVINPSIFTITLSGISSLFSISSVRYLRIRNGLGYEQIISWDGSTQINVTIDVEVTNIFKEVYGRYDDVKILYTDAVPLPTPVIQRTSINCPNTDLNVLNFLAAADINNTVIEDALNALVITLKINNMWNIFDAIYPFVGGNAFAHKFNLKNPLDSDVAFRLSFAGGWLHTSTGAKANGAAFANTFYKESLSSSLNNKHISVYNRLDLSGLQSSMGVTNNVNISTDILPKYNSGGVNCFMRNSSATGAFLNADARGFFLNNRQNATQIKAQRNGTINTLAANSTTLQNGVYYIGANFNTVSQTGAFYSQNQFAFASIGRSFTDAQAVIFATAVQTFNTSLGRQV